MSFEDRVVLVTGGVRGIGLAVARAFQEKGAKGHVTWRSSEHLAKELEPEFGAGLHQVNHLDWFETFDFVFGLSTDEGRLDHVVHCVGEYDLDPGKDTADHLRRMWQSNVETAHHVMDAASTPLAAHRGSAVFFGCAGLEGMKGRRETSYYAAAKSALLVMVRSWALAHASQGVRVNMVSPGIIPHAHASPDTLDPKLQASIPMGVPGTPRDVANACLWLCSDDAAHVTGVNLPVTGGWQG